MSLRLKTLQALRLRAMDVLLAAGQHDPGPLRAFIEARPEQGRLLGLLIQTLGEASEGGLQEQVRGALPLQTPMPSAVCLLVHPFELGLAFSNSFTTWLLLADVIGVDCDRLLTPWYHCGRCA